MSSHVIVLGGGIIGLSTALLLERQGHLVTVLEQDSARLPDSPESAWSTWDRRGVSQFRLPHYLHSGGRVLLDEYLPEVTQALLDADCLTLDTLSLMPPSIADRSHRPGDERFVTVTGRRSALEYAVAQVASERVNILRGVSVAGLVTGSADSDGIPHVSGVRTGYGSELRADLVIDATGRRSRLPDWLRGIGAQTPLEDGDESSFIYYTRHFRTTNGQMPAYRAGLLTNFHTFSLLTLPGDGGTWSVTVFFFAGDAALKELQHVDRWTKLVQACPPHAHWLNGEPISDILSMGGITNRNRRLVVDGSPVVTGLVAVGDAWACTNPIRGRGMTMGLMHAVGTAQVVSEHLDEPNALALAHDRMSDARIMPWYRDTVSYDHVRSADIKAAIQGLPARPAGLGEALEVAMLHDASMFRAAMEITSLLALPGEVMARLGVVDRIMELADIHPAVIPPGPTRAELLKLVG